MHSKENDNMGMKHKKGAHAEAQSVSAAPASVWSTVATVAANVLLYVLTLAIILVALVFGAMKVIVSNDAAKTTFITTVLETGQMKFLASLALSEEEIAEVVAQNSMKDMEDSEVNSDLIKPIFNSAGDGTVIDPEYAAQPDIEIVEIAGLTYKGTLMIVKNPATVSVATIHQGGGKWPALGITLKEIADREGAIGAINAGLYSSTNNTGGYPFGTVVSNGEIVRNIPNEWPGLVLVGLTEDNILQIIDLSGRSAASVASMIRELKIRDAVCFQEENSVDNNHFVHLIINGIPRNVTGSGSGLNPRTAIGQRADGTLLLLVTDGRGSSSHAGASAADLIDIMTRYGAVNAANLDGGSSTCMYYNGEYLQNSVTFYYSQTSWRLPFAFVVKQGDK